MPEKPAKKKVAKAPKKKTAKPKKKAKKKAAKKKTAKPKKATKKKAAKPKTKIQITKSSSIAIPVDGVAATRYAARLQYVYDPERRTVEWWHAHAFADKISIHQFKKWSAEDRWTAGRDEYWQYVESKIAKAVIQEVVREQVTELQELVDARRVAKGFTTPESGGEMPTPKTYGEAVGAFVTLDKRVDDKRALITENLPLALGGESTQDPHGTPDDLPFDEDELRDLSHAMIRKRQADVDASIQEPQSDIVPPDDEG